MCATFHHYLAAGGKASLHAITRGFCLLLLLPSEHGVHQWVHLRHVDDGPHEPAAEHRRAEQQMLESVENAAKDKATKGVVGSVLGKGESDKKQKELG